jgi:hypothetical protein
MTRALVGAAFWLVVLLWASWILLTQWALVSEFGAILPPGPVDAHDEIDLLFWAALMAWTYMSPLLLLLAGATRRRWREGPAVAATISMIFLAIFALGAWQRSLPADDVLAARIDRKVMSRRPGLSLDRYARFYAHSAGGSVSGVYVFSNVGYQPIVGRAGETVWTRPTDLPVISDGGCGVLLLDYDAIADVLRSLECSSNESIPAPSR